MSKTLDYYNKNAAAYIESSINADVSELYVHFLPRLKKGAHILDLGCGSGRDSKYFQTQGFKVTAVDGSKEFCRLASKFLGQEVRYLLFEELDYTEEFDGIWACASLLHVPKAEIQDVLHKVENALTSSGVLYMSFKYGKEERTAGARSFSDYTEEDIDWLMAKTNLQCSEYWISGDVRPDRTGEMWLNIIAGKE